MFDDLRKQLNRSRSELESNDLLLRSTTAGLKANQQALAQAQRNGDQERLASLHQQRSALSQQMDSLQSQRQELTGWAEGLSREFGDWLAGLEGELPGVKNYYPVALLPVRLETRFMQAQESPELWVRIYPDDLHIETHETPLTSAELEAGKAYWTAVSQAGNDLEQQKTAWAGLVSQLGTNRAAWVAKKLTPDPQAGGNGQPVFPEVPVRGASWSQPARALTLPDRFVIMTFQGGKQIHSQPGRLIPSPLIVGPDPQGVGLKPDGGKLDLPPELRWLVDFDAAIEVGMAVKIPLTPQQAAEGFDQVLALGVRLSLDAIESSELLQSLFESHHYTDGLSLIPTGTPTNYTEATPPGKTPDDMPSEESWQVERSAPLFTPQRAAGEYENQLDFDQQMDGQRLAEALGLPYETFQHVRGANNSDGLEARAMNNALFPATLGYYFKELVTPIGEDKKKYVQPIQRVRRFMIDYVSGRGPVAALRVGAQPYGVLLTTPDPHFWENASRSAGLIPEVVNSLEQIWQALSQQAARVGFGNDPEQTLLDILALHPSSVEFYQRHASTSNVSYNYLIFNNLGGMSVSAEQERVARAMQLLAQINLQQLLPTNIMSLLWFKRAALLDGPLVDEAPLSETRLLPPAAPEGNYVDWILKQDVAALRDNDFGKDDQGNPRPVPRALLYLLLNQAMQREQIDTHHKLLYTEGRFALDTEIQFLNIQQPKQQTVWHQMAEPLSISGTTPAGLFLMTADLSAISEAAELESTRASLSVLAKLSTARLERLLAEHLDLCSYRLDAWLTGLLYQYLCDGVRRLRIELDSEDYHSLHSGGRGVYIGAYGYLEDLRPAAPRIPVPPEQIPKDFTDGAPLQFAPDNQGYIHAPSIGQATGAAILRNARLTHASSPNRGMMSVNLSSRRVRSAQWYLEGMRAGQSAAALLGYQFERGLHDNHLDQYLMLFRQRFPYEVDPAKQPPNTPVEALAARNVVNGKLLVEAHQKSGFPYGITALNAAPAQDQTAIQAVVQATADALDAVADLALAEGVYQAALGRHERAAAILDAVNRGAYPPEVEFVRTPRSGSALTTTIGLGLSRVLPALQWASSAPREIVEPRLNAWFDQMLGDPADIRCLESIDGQALPVAVSAAELGLSAYDFVMSAGEDATTVSALERRIDYALRRREGLTDDQKVTLDLINPDPNWGDSVRTFFEVLPLARALHRVASQCRSLSAEDYLPPQESVADENNRQRIDLAELKNRADAAVLALQTARSLLSDTRNAAEASSGQAADLESLRLALIGATAFGLPDFPSSASGASEKILKTLLDQADSALKGLDARLEAAQAAASKAAAIPPSQADSQAAGWLAVFEAVFGGSFKVLPLFTLHNPVEITQSLASQPELLNGAAPLALDEWLHSLTRLRPRVAYLEEIRLFLELSGESDRMPGFTPTQVPHTPGAGWFAFPQSAASLPGTARALALCLPAGYIPADPQCGLLIDEWVEVIPNREEMTGIAFHFDQPNAEPPQALLLALPAVVNDSDWRWDDLIAAVLQAFRLAKIRTVDTDQVDSTGWAQFLPALVSAVSPSIATAGLDLLKNSSLYAKLGEK